MHILIDKGINYYRVYVFEAKEDAQNELNLKIEQYTGYSTKNLPFIGEHWHGYDRNKEEISLRIRECEYGCVDEKLKHQEEELRILRERTI